MAAGSQLNGHKKEPKRPDARSRKPARKSAIGDRPFGERRAFGKSGKPGLSAVGFRLSEKSHEATMPIVLECLSGCEDLKTL
jgi:hypothetical protein